jgi:4-hydroxybenzoyl-CoA reductase subunit beta
MLTLPNFEMKRPASFAEAVALLAQDDATPMAGGTDLVPNMKHGLCAPRVVVDLKSIEEGRELLISPTEIRLGALVSLDQLATHGELQKILPALSRAAGEVAGPQLRRMGTLGGNICLDTRCVYYNQTYFWRSALGFCLKKDGTVCHVVAGGQKCVAAASNDTAPVLWTLGAKLRLLSAHGEREVPVDKFYHADGIRNHVLQPGELVREVIIPRPALGTKMAYEKLRTRKAIDFPLLSLALVLQQNESRAVESMRVVVSALAARPREINGLDALVRGQTLTPDLIEKLGAQVFRQCHPMTNILSDTEWRREMVPILFARAVAQALGETSAQAAE